MTSDENSTGFFSSDPELDGRRVRMLLDTVAEVNSTLDLDELLVRIVDRTIELTGAERGLILLLEEGELKPKVARDCRLEDLPLDVEHSREVPKTVARTGLPQTRGMRAEDMDSVLLTESIGTLGLRALMCVPLRLKDRVIGVLYVDSRTDRTKRFRRSDFHLLQALASQAAIAIENANLRAHRLVAERLKEQFRIAARIQQGLLPAPAIRLPGLEVYGVSRPCEETGGDFFDYVRERDGRIGLIVGDVSDHGIKSAMHMVGVRARLRALLMGEDDPARAMRRLNRALYPDMNPNYYATLLWGEIDIQTWAFRYVVAGHDVPLLLRGDTGEFEEVPGLGSGRAVAQFDEREYRVSGPVELEAGDLLVLYTDGITEACPPHGEGEPRTLFGQERLEATLKELADRSAQEIATGILREVEVFARAGYQEDDRTVVAVKILD